MRIVGIANGCDSVVQLHVSRTARVPGDRVDADCPRLPSYRFLAAHRVPALVDPLSDARASSPSMATRSPERNGNGSSGTMDVAASGHDPSGVAIVDMHLRLGPLRMTRSLRDVHVRLPTDSIVGALARRARERPCDRPASGSCFSTRLPPEVHSPPSVDDIADEYHPRAHLHVASVRRPGGHVHPARRSSFEYTHAPETATAAMPPFNADGHRATLHAHDRDVTTNLRTNTQAPELARSNRNAA